MQFTDSHLHLQEYKTNDAQQIIAKLRALGFTKVVCASTSPQDWQHVAHMVLLAPDMVIPAFGVHPWYLESADSNFAAELKAILRRFPAAWVGECGLDNLKAGNPKKQEQFFVAQIDIAKELGRPLNIHALKADNAIIRLLPQMPQRFMLHSFSGSKEILTAALKHGAYISLSAAILKRKNHLDVVRALPKERLLLESDGPFLSDYTDIPSLAKTIAEIKNIDYASLVAQVNLNFEEFCRG